jgi:cathepsin A (carboxypeptidase C)
MALTSPYQATGLNPYDIRIKCEKPPLCYDFSNVQKWLNLKATKEALGVDLKKSHAWNSCNFGINSKFRSDWMKSFAPFVADLLNAGIPALIYAGDGEFARCRSLSISVSMPLTHLRLTSLNFSSEQSVSLRLYYPFLYYFTIPHMLFVCLDYICNYLGNKAWSLGLEWNGKEAFNAAEEHEWQGSGLARTSSGLTFLQVYDAGHMVSSAVALSVAYMESILTLFVLNRYRLISLKYLWI